MFIFSICSVFLSSFFCLSILLNTASKPNSAPLSGSKISKIKSNLGFIFLFLIIFAQLVLSFELLSLFKQISVKGMLFINTFFLFLSALIWYKKGVPLYRTKIKEETSKIIKALKRDKLLLFISFCFIVYIVSLLFMALFFPVRYGDALGYYLPRCTAWIQNGSINSYLTIDSRELIMPVNMEFLYTWVLLFLKNEIGIPIFSFLFYINSIYVIYNFLGELGFCRRKRLWSIFVFSSLALIYIEAQIPIADVAIGSLLLTCTYLFYVAVKYKSKLSLFFSALAYSLAIGVKTTAIIAFPALILLLLFIFYIYRNNFTNTTGKNKKGYIYFLIFLIFAAINFIIFSAYQYILNIINYANPVSNSGQLMINSFRGGIKGYLSNLIKYTFLIFDFSGVADIFKVGPVIEKMQDKVLAFLLNADKNSYTSFYFENFFPYNSRLYIVESFLGILGIFAFYPAVLVSIVFSFIKRKSKKTKILAALACFYILNIIVFARTMVYTKFNMRYLIAFVVVAAPVIVYTYIKKNPNLYKIIVSFFLFIYLFYNSHAHPAVYIIEYFKYKSLPAEKQIKNRHFILNDCDAFRVRDYFINKKREKIAVLSYIRENPRYYIYKLRLDGFYIDTILPEIMEQYNLSDYAYIIASKEPIYSSEIKNFKERINSNNKNYITSCTYKNYKGEIIKSSDDIPVVVYCDFPEEYIEKQGFRKINNIYTGEYIIYKNSKKNNNFSPLLV